MSPMSGAWGKRERFRLAAGRIGRGIAALAGRLFPHRGVLARYCLLSYAVLLVNGSGNLARVNYDDVLTVLFVLSAYTAYTAAYLLPAMGILLLLDAIAASLLRSPSRRAARARALMVYVPAVLLFSLVQIVIFADRFVYVGYGFHLNGFVWNLLMTEGGVESLGGSSSTTLTFALIMFGLVILQAALLWVAATRAVRVIGSFMARPRYTFLIGGLLLLLGAFQATAFGLSSLYNYRSVMRAGQAIPFFQGVTFRRMARRFGIKPPRPETFHAEETDGSLNYPLKPLVRAPEAQRWNIVWLVAESWRHDMLTPEIMPETYAFAQHAVRFNHHYSTGNGTRMGLFGMFYGLYGNYWFSALREQRGPVLMDLLIQDNYQFQMYTSAKFTYPEFDRTLFAGVSAESLHQNDSHTLGWECDREYAGQMTEFIRQRDPNRPFMTFMFFESPHARYYFPPDCAIRKPYLEEFNYATVDLEKEAPLIKNRYINSCRHLDTQFGRVLKCIEEEGLLDSTLVLITGDHGEEFMEHGRWGHNSAYNDEQTVVPLVIRAPGRTPRVVDRITSHLDVPATLLNLLGVINPPEDYSLGEDLLGDDVREYAIISGWTDMAYVDSENKAVFPTTLGGVKFGESVTDANDIELPDDESFMRSHQRELVQVLKEMSRFSQ
jgi:hypothetical protein